MAHEVETMVSVESDNQEQYRQATPWHGLGTVVQEAMTAVEALTEGGLDWEVEKVERYDFVDGEYVEIPSAFSIRRTTDNRVLGGVGNRYEPLQNVDAFAFADELVGDKDNKAKYHTAGSLRGGSVVWATLKLPKTLKIAGLRDETIDQYLMLTNSHDGTKSVEAVVTPVRTVCANTWTIALRNASRSFKIRHTPTMMNRIQEAARVLGTAEAFGAELQKVAEQLIGEPLTIKQFDNLLEKLVPTKDKEKAALTRAENRQDEIKTIYVNRPDLQNIKDTKWGALQAVIDFNDHHIDGRGDNQDEKRMHRILNMPNLTHQAFAYLTKTR